MITVKTATLKNTTPGLMAKLCVPVSQNMVEALRSLSDVQHTKEEEIFPSIRNYLTLVSRIYAALAVHYQAVQAKNENKIGYAVAFSALAIDEATPLKVKCTPPVDEFMPKFTAAKASIEKFNRACTRENDSVFFAKVPKKEELSIIRNGVLVLKAIPYNPPNAIEVPISLNKASECILQ
eukprot:TRINITY_DN4231_c0_g1_i7.p2 TRINITY_DN4231_c0_g1~~TRINITY_DN4231_c0_g1_i7.p2  ORF type:complete len:180 (+),score=27.30 TRINITY_DN4231_c0_g1_i7:745-1284(+)